MVGSHLLRFFLYCLLSDSDIGDYDYELSLEMKRQKIQRELMKLEQENLDKREEIVIKKEEAQTKARGAAVSKQVGHLRRSLHRLVQLALL